jgi:hypothetical protein
MKTTLYTLAFALGLSFVLASCSKNESVPVQFLLTDAPATYDEVNIHIVGMQVNIGGDSTSWISLNAKDTTVNLLDLQNGVTTLIADGDVPDGVLKEVRFILGTDNNVVIGTNTYPLATPSSTTSGLKIKIGKDLNETMNTFVLDFDASLSVKEENGSYKLDPVIKLK